MNLKRQLEKTHLKLMKSIIFEQNRVMKACYHWQRECRLVPTEAQSPINNANVGNASIGFGKDQASFYLYDHLGNTRVTYSPKGIITHQCFT